MIQFFFEKLNLKKSENIGFYSICFFLVTIIALIDSYANPFLKEIPSADSSAYLAMAWFKQKGFVVYQDYFDHKGPLIYIINQLFARGVNNWTIWIFEMIAVFVSALFIYKTISKFYEKEIAFASTIYAILVFGTLSNGGNDVEEYALPFICIGLYIFTDMLKSEKETSWGQVIVLGMTCGGVLMLRPNMISLWLSFGPSVFIYYIINKKNNAAVKLALGYIIGIIISILPFLTYLINNKALFSFYESYWKYNLEYSSVKIQQIFLSEWRMLTKLQEYNGIVSLGLLCLTYSFNINFSKNTNVKPVYYLSFLLYTVFQLMLVDMSGKGYEHYYMCLVPILGIAFALQLNFIWEKTKKMKISFINQTILALLLMTVLSGILIPRTGLFIVKRIKEIDNPEKSTIELQKMAEYVRLNTKDDDTILCLGAGLGYSSIYWAAERLPASKYYFTPPAEDPLKTEIFNTIQNDINCNKPEIIIRNSQNVYLDEINLYEYQLKKEFGYNQIYMMR